MRVKRPGITQIGRVELTPDGSTWITGWGLTVCAGGCSCHRHPANGQLYIAEDQAAGTLGVRCFLPMGCACCEPWTADELAAVVRDLAVLDALPAEPRG